MRTEVSTVIQSTHTGKWAVSFNTYCGNPGDEWLANTVTSAHVFETEDDAWEAGSRALTHLELHDKWPNMCEHF